MRRLAPLTLLAGLLLGADFPRTDLDRLQGTWATVRVESEGKEVSTSGDKLVIEGDRFRTSGTLVVDGVIRFPRGDSKPRFEKETQKVGGRNHRKRYVGLYELEGDTLKECLALPGAEPPSELASKPGSHHVLDTWKRTEGSTESGIEGAWVLVERISVGARQGKERTRGITMTVRPAGKAGEHRYCLRNDYEGHGRLELDPTSNPKRINLISDGGLESDHLYGIYELRGDRFTNSFFVKRKGGRPADFTTRPGDFRWVTIYGRDVSSKPANRKPSDTPTSEADALAGRAPTRSGPTAKTTVSAANP